MVPNVWFRTVRMLVYYVLGQHKVCRDIKNKIIKEYLHAADFPCIYVVVDKELLEYRGISGGDHIYMLANQHKLRNVRTTVGTMQTTMKLDDETNAAIAFNTLGSPDMDVFFAVMLNDYIKKTLGDLYEEYTAAGSLDHYIAWVGDSNEYCMCPFDEEEDCACVKTLNKAIRLREKVNNIRSAMEANEKWHFLGKNLEPELCLFGWIPQKLGTNVASKINEVYQCDWRALFKNKTLLKRKK